MDKTQSVATIGSIAIGSAVKHVNYSDTLWIVISIPRDALNYGIMVHNITDNDDIRIFLLNSLKIAINDEC
jgi:hypothetical protein